MRWSSFQRAIDSRSRRMMFHVKHLPYRNHGRAVLRSALTATHVPPLRPDVALHATMQEGLLTRRSSSERQQAIRSRGGLLMRSRGYLSQISTDCLMGRARSRPIDFLTRVLRQHHSKRVCLMRMQHQSVAHDLSLQSTFPAVSRETRTQSTHHWVGLLVWWQFLQGFPGRCSCLRTEGGHRGTRILDQDSPGVLPRCPLTSLPCPS